MSTQRPAEHAPFLGEFVANTEIGVGLRQMSRGGFAGPWPKPLPTRPAGSDRDLGLGDVIARSDRSGSLSGSRNTERALALMIVGPAMKKASGAAIEPLRRPRRRGTASSGRPARNMTATAPKLMARPVPRSGWSVASPRWQAQQQRRRPDRAPGPDLGRQAARAVDPRERWRDARLHQFRGAVATCMKPRLSQRWLPPLYPAEQVADQHEQHAAARHRTGSAARGVNQGLRARGPISMRHGRGNTAKRTPCVEAQGMDMSRPQRIEHRAAQELATQPTGRQDHAPRGSARYGAWDIGALHVSGGLPARRAAPRGDCCRGGRSGRALARVRRFRLGQRLGSASGSGGGGAASVCGCGRSRAPGVLSAATASAACASSGGLRARWRRTRRHRRRSCAAMRCWRSLPPHGPFVAFEHFHRLGLIEQEGHDIARNRIGCARAAAMLDNHGSGIARLVERGEADEVAVIAVLPSARPCRCQY